MGAYRMERLSEQIRSEISSLIVLEKIKDPRVSKFLSINRVELSRDLSQAKILVSSFLSDGSLEKGLEGLKSAAGFIRTFLAKKMTVHHVPRLIFVPDSSIKEGFSIVEKLNRLEKSDGENVPQ